MSDRACVVCRERPAAVPDRDHPSRRVAVCRECHAARLYGDLLGIIAAKIRALKTTTTKEK